MALDLPGFMTVGRLPLSEQQAFHHTTLQSFFNDHTFLLEQVCKDYKCVSGGKKKEKYSRAKNLSEFTKNHKGVDELLEYK